MQPGPLEIAVTLSGVVMIALALWYLRPPSARRPAATSTAFQEVVVRILPDRFDPSTIILAANTPAKIRFQRIDESDEWETCVAPGLDIERKLPAGKVTTIDVPSDQPGVYPFHSTVTRRDGTIVIAAA